MLGSHQKCWLWGRHAVLESLRGGRWLPLEVLFDSEVLLPNIREEVLEACQQHDLPCRELPASELRKLCGSGEHQGLMAKMPPYPYADPHDVLSRLHARSAVLVLAGVQDPYNFGSILRSADQFGLDAVIVPIDGQASVSSHVSRSSVGAVNYLDLVEVDDLADCCRQLKQQGLQLFAATEKGNCSPADADLQQGSVIIIGNEATGIPQSLLQLADEEICIPLQGHVDSLNAAVAAGILCYELRRQRIAGATTAPITESRRHGGG